MQLPGTSSAHLTYCLNVHAGETLADSVVAIRDHAAPIRDLVAPGQPFGLGLRIANAASLELESPARLQELQAALAEGQFYAFTVNGFPYGAFHDAAVKENVYRPDWRDPARRAYTCRLARQLARLLPERLAGSISTVPCSFKSWIKTAADVSAMVNALADTAVFLANLEHDTGREIHLGLEPEPDCYLETTNEVIAFFKEELWTKGSARLAATTGCTPAAAETLLRRHLGVCFDTCHLALQFEDLSDSLKRLARTGIRISKIQLSAALRTQWNPEAVGSLSRFCDPVYLHQVKAKDGAHTVSRGDLAEALSMPAKLGEEWRVHCHVPLYFTRDGPLASTSDQLTPAFFQTVRELQVAHIEIETYTFNVLPEPLRQLGIDRSIAEEYRWVLRQWLQ